MKISTAELDGLIRFIESQPYRPLKAFETKMLRQFKKEREKRGRMKKNLCVIAKAIQAAQRNLPGPNGKFATEVIQAVAQRISTALAEHDSKFNSDLFLHTCGVPV